MKCVILAGGKGTRISEAGTVLPKPLVEIGGKPILWHVMKLYSYYGIIDEFIICCGHLGNYIKEYFINYSVLNSDITIDMESGTVIPRRKPDEDWKVTLVDTGQETLTGGRLMRVREYLKDEPFFAMTYGDGLSDINLTDELRFHMRHGKTATVVAARPAGRFGMLDLSKNCMVEKFGEKIDNQHSWVNAGFFILGKEVFDYLHEDVMFEGYPLETLAREGELMAYKHEGFFMPMDTQKDRMELEKMWNSRRAPWRVWNV